MRILLLCAFAAATFAQTGVYRFTVDQDRLSGAVDFSALNHPIAAADRVVVRDGHFSAVGGRRVRFFGMNLAFGANFPAEQDAARIAKRLRRLGVNLVRLHHMDSNPDRDPANAGSTLTTGPYPTLNPVAVARLRRFLDALKAEGIYANLNIHVGYRFRPEVDGVPALPGMEMPTQSKPLHVYFPRMVELQEQYTRKLIDALKLKNDPVLAMVELDNETSLLHGWMTGALDRYAAGEYRDELRRQWRADTKSESELVAATDTANPLRNAWIIFLAGRDREYLKRLTGAVRASTDSFVPVTGTQMGYGGLMNLDAQSLMDYQDNHFYIDHYNFPHQSWDQHDWRMRDSSSVGSGLATFINMAASRVAGQPYTVSEYNQPWPNRQAAEIGPTLAAFGAFQDWDAIIHFAYAHGRDWETEVPGGFNMNGDWTKFPNTGQAALLFRAGVVETGRSAVTIPIDYETHLRFGRERKPGAIAPFLTAAGFDAATALLHPVAIQREDKALPKTASLAGPYRSDTGQLIYDAAAKVYTLAAPKAAGVFGFIATTKATAGAMEVQLAASARGFATILLTALDDQPIERSASLLLTTPGYTLGTVPGTNPPAMQTIVPYPGTTDWWTVQHEPAFAERPSGRNSGGTAPVWMERVESTVTVRSSAKSLMVYPLDGSGKRLRAIPTDRTGNGFRFHLQADGQDFAPWYELVATR